MRIPIYNNIILYTIGALAGTCFIIGISALIEKYFKRNWFYKAMVYEGQNTVIMLSLNRVVQKLIVEKIYYNTIYHLFSNSLFERYVYVIFGITLELIMFIPVIYIVNRFIPISVGRKKCVINSQIKEEYSKK